MQCQQSQYRAIDAEHGHVSVQVESQVQAIRSADIEVYSRPHFGIVET